MEDSTPHRAGTRVLLVDDDLQLQENVKDYLEPYGFELIALFDGKDIRRTIADAAPDIVLLDVMLPGDDGFTVLQHLRAVSRVPVIMLTARGDDADRIVGLEMGADDYLAKPYNPRELLARIKAVLRRSARPEDDPETETSSGMLRAGPLTLDLKRQSLWLGEACIPLTSTEFRILRVFMSSPEEVLSREVIQTRAFGEGYYCSDRNIDVYVSRVRTTLREFCGESFIRTVWGTGYCWVREDFRP